MRKPVLSTVAVVLVALFVLASVSMAQDGDGPEILIEEMRHDLGEVFEAKSYKHSFTVKNVGNAELKIEKVQPS